MSAVLDAVRHPGSARASALPSQLRSGGLAAGLAGIALVSVALVASLAVAADGGPGRADTLAWTFGLTTAGFVVLKSGIALTLVGILLRVRDRIDAAKSSLPALAGPTAVGPASGSEVATSFGRASRTIRALDPLPIHRMARLMWAPLVVMGPMLVAAGLVTSILQASADSAGDAVAYSAWTQGLQFLGEGLVLAGISFLLGVILGELRRGGGEVQEALGVTVWTLKMPLSAKLFVVLMATGVMASIAQFALYVVAANVSDPTTWFAVLGPLREVGLGLLLSGIVLALFTIGTVLGFQFDRMRTLVRGEER